MNQYLHNIKEAGRNGTVEVYADRLIRTLRKTIGKNDVQTILLRSVASVTLNRKTFGADEVTVVVGAQHYTWRSPTASVLAEQITAAS